MRTFQSWIEKSTVEFKKKKKKAEHSIGAFLKDLKTTISLLIKCERIYYFTTSYISPQSILLTYFQIHPKITFKEINKVHASLKAQKRRKPALHLC